MQDRLSNYVKRSNRYSLYSCVHIQYYIRISCIYTNADKPHCVYWNTLLPYQSLGGRKHFCYLSCYKRKSRCKLHNSSAYFCNPFRAGQPTENRLRYFSSRLVVRKKEHYICWILSSDDVQCIHIISHIF